MYCLPHITKYLLEQEHLTNEYPKQEHLTNEYPKQEQTLFKGLRKRQDFTPLKNSKQEYGKKLAKAATMVTGPKCFWWSSRGLGLLRTTSQSWPLSGGRGASWRPGGGVGMDGLQPLVGRHRDLNPGPPIKLYLQS